MSNLFDSPFYHMLDLTPTLWSTYGRGLAPIDRQWNAHLVKKDDTYVVQAVLPGLSKSDVKVNMMDARRLRISVDKESGNSSSYSKQSFRQEFYIPDDGNIDNIDARMVNGVLEIVVPRTKHDRPSSRVIPVM